MKEIELQSPPKQLAEAAQEIISVGKILYQRGLVPATSGNFSCRLATGDIAITVSGRPKGQLGQGDVMQIDPNGVAIAHGKRASAEALLHAAIYRVRLETNAILHMHSVNATVFSRLLKTDNWRLHEYEMQKAFAGVTSHKQVLNVPIFENTQNIPDLAELTAKYLADHPNVPGYLIRGHGLYTWGGDLDETLKHIEAFEFLLSCEIELMRCRS